MLSLYIHWPWCKKKCPYCDFNSHVAASIPEQDYAAALLAEMRYLAKKATRMPVGSVFFGGGTPSLMQPQTVELLLCEAEKLFGFTSGVEVTLEANPTSVEHKKFEAFANAGVNRFSIGMQSLKAEELKFLGREHTKKEALNAIEAAMAVSENVNLDLIYGLPGQSPEVWQENLEMLLPLGTQHISCYQLTIEKNTAFYADWRKGKLTPISAEKEATFYAVTNAVLKAHGYEQYEVSNYAKAGFPCQHNVNIWRYGSYLGIGAGAHGRMLTAEGRVATQNYKIPQKYMAVVAEHGHGQYETVFIPPEEEVIETLLMGLRLCEGVPLERLKSFGVDPFAVLSQSGIALMQENGFLENKPTLLQPTPQGLTLLNSVLETIIQVS